jgi:CRP-like cAMP-binding protein
LDGLIQRLDQLAQSGPPDGLSFHALEMGDVLFRQGDPSDAVYLVVSGALDARMEQDDGGEVTLNRMANGAVIGELGIMTEQPRTASIHALIASSVLRLSRGYFNTLPPDEQSLLVDKQEAVRRWRRQQLATVLKDLFGTLDVAELHRWQNQMDWLHLVNGQSVYQTGEVADGLYLVVNGRLRYTRRYEDGDSVSGEICAGQPFGEVGMRVAGRQSADVRAIRETDVVKIPTDVFEQMVAKHPAFMDEIYRIYARRHKADAQPIIPASASTTIAVLPADGTVDAGGFAEALAEALSGFGGSLAIDSARFSELFGQPIIWQPIEEITGTPAIVALLNELEAANKYLVFVGDPDDGFWTQRCIGQADRVIVLADGNSSPAPGSPEKLLGKLALELYTELVFWHPSKEEMIVDVSAWEAGRDRFSIVQLVAGDSESLKSLAAGLIDLVD